LKRGFVNFWLILPPLGCIVLVLRSKNTKSKAQAPSLSSQPQTMEVYQTVSGKEKLKQL
jgi:hypothetical protein